MAVDDLIEKEADVTLPKKDPLVAKSLSQYVDLILLQDCILENGMQKRKSSAP